MADELNFPYDPGRTLVARIYFDAWLQEGSDISMAEVGSGLYTASMPVTAPIYVYNVLFADTTTGDEVVGQGTIAWDGSSEILDELQIELLTSMIFGGRSIDFDGDDFLGWQRVELDVETNEVARYNLFDQDGLRINEDVSSFLARGGMISAEVLI